MKIRNFILPTIVFSLIGVYVQSASAQTVGNSFGVTCEGNHTTPIKCGYFTEGYQDGVNDAKNNQDPNYKRYKRKYEDRYRESYRAGYDQGFSSVRVYSRWTNKQKDIYRQGYNDGDDDKDRAISRLPRRYEGQYDKTYEAHYRRGYLDGYDQKPRTYDVPVTNVGNRRGTNNGRFPRRNRNRFGSTTGTLNWVGRVDNRVNIILQGGTARVRTVAGRNLGQGSRTISGALPRRQATVTVKKRDGRGSAVVTQQPNRVNNYTTIVQVNDPGRGADNYRLEISWQTSNALETYSTGRLRWKGRVDQTVNIRISGDFAKVITLSGREAIENSNNMTGYLARRRGSVTVKKLDGRGTVRILEQPSRQNNFIAVIQIFDPKSSDDEYEIEVNW